MLRTFYAKKNSVILTKQNYFIEISMQIESKRQPYVFPLTMYENCLIFKKKGYGSK